MIIAKKCTDKNRYPHLSRFCIPAPKTIIAKDVPNAAPWEIPRVDAEASGLRKMLCIAQPTVARPIPATIAVTILGIRILNTTVDACLLPCQISVMITSFRESPAEPALIANKLVSNVVAPRNKIKSSLKRIYSFMFCNFPSILITLY